MSKIDDLEEQCEDALFELCDARERYPLRCANEFRKSIQLQSDIHMTKVCPKLNIMDKPSDSKQRADFNIDFNRKEAGSFENLDRRLQTIASKLNNLKAVAEQVNREKMSEINKLLKN